MNSFHVPKPVLPNSVIVIGFLGGFEHWNDPHRGVRKVALDLRDRGLPNVYIETIENHRRDLALKLISRSLTIKGNRPHQATRVSNVRIILYGQSWGGAATIYTARDLRKLGVDVDLTVQVDSVGLRDTIIPSNVHAAANLYQHDPLTFEGAPEIRAEDPTRTRIIENTRLSYLFRSFDTLSKQDASWARRTFGGSHAKMETDEVVWHHVEDLILQAIQ
jgi:pimeloyl-ACP methyl ester carboxylesterase